VGQEAALANLFLSAFQAALNNLPYIQPQGKQISSNNGPDAAFLSLRNRSGNVIAF
jgi:hypothetical protein